MLGLLNYVKNYASTIDKNVYGDQQEKLNVFRVLSNIT